MTKIKICGITSLEDAVCAAEAGVDAIGFVFAESPRQMTTEAVRRILTTCDFLPAGVGVFVDAAPETVRVMLSASACSVAQLHGQEGEEHLEALWPYAVIKTVHVDPEATSLDLRPLARASAVLLDTYVPGRAGGTGRRFDPQVAAELSRAGWRIIMAGGLTPDNVGEVVRTVRPYGVDVSTGVESAPAKKDYYKVRDFVAAVRAAEVG